MSGLTDSKVGPALHRRQQAQAFAVAYTFLAVNDAAIAADEQAVITFVLPLYERGNLSFAKLDAWLRKNTKAR
jgi:prophage maintenance system killer protein